MYHYDDLLQGNEGRPGRLTSARNARVTKIRRRYAFHHVDDSEHHHYHQSSLGASLCTLLYLLK